MNTKKLKWAEALVAIACGFDGWSRNFFGEWNSRLGHKGLTCSLLVQLKTLNRVTTQNSLGPSLVCLVCLSACPRSPSRTNLAISGFISTSPIGQTPSFIKKKKNASFLWSCPAPGSRLRRIYLCSPIVTKIFTIFRESTSHALSHL